MLKPFFSQSNNAAHTLERMELQISDELHCSAFHLLCNNNERMHCISSKVAISRPLHVAGSSAISFKVSTQQQEASSRVCTIKTFYTAYLFNENGPENVTGEISTAAEKALSMGPTTLLCVVSSSERERERDKI